MDTKTFYDNLREEDRERVRLTVEEFKAKGFEVYVAGSSLERKNYNDIDLVVKPRNTGHDLDARLGSVIETLKQKGGNEVPNVRIKPDSISLGPSFEDFRRSLLGDIPTYCGSTLVDRTVVLFGRASEPQTHEIPEVLMGRDVVDAYSKVFGNTKIDISVSYYPFALNPETKHIKL